LQPNDWKAFFIRGDAVGVASPES